MTVKEWDNSRKWLAAAGSYAGAGGLWAVRPTEMERISADELLAHYPPARQDDHLWQALLKRMPEDLSPADYYVNQATWQGLTATDTERPSLH
jgi:hypothetical protein